MTSDRTKRVPARAAPPTGSSEAARQKPSPRPDIHAGARWLRCDLHVHTPFDGEKNFGEDVRGAIAALRNEKPQKLAAIAERFVEACRSAADGSGMDLVALTDHNSVEGYRRLRPYLDSIAQQARDRRESMPVVLPGVEFSVGGERPMHFLVVFAAETSPEAVDRAIQHVFGARELFDPRTGTPRATGDSIGRFLDGLYEYCHPPTGERWLEFVLLPAHADGARGVGRETGARDSAVATTLWDQMRGHLRQWAIRRTDWNGFETARPFGELPQAFRELLLEWAAAKRGEDWEQLSDARKKEYREQPHWALIECSDPHRYEAIGSRFSWLKMEVPDVEGIRLALLDPASRLRRMSEGPPLANYPHLDRVQIRNTDFFDDIEVPLHACLTTLIGGRGAGKSTVIEYIRHGLDRSRPDDPGTDEGDPTRANVEDLLRPKQARDFGESPGTLLPSYEILVDLTVAGRPYRVRRAAKTVEVIPDPDGAVAAPVALDVRTLISPRILSQRQIARIAKDPSAQRRELDGLVGSDYLRQFEAQRRAVVDALTRLQMTRANLRARANDLPARQTEARKVADQIAFLEQGGRKEIFERFQTFQREQQWLQDVNRELEAVAMAMADAADTGASIGEHLAVPPGGPSRDWILTVAQRAGEVLQQSTVAVRGQADKLQATAATFALEQGSRWQPESDKARREYDTLRAEMKAKGVEFGQHEKLLQQRALLEREIRELSKIDQQVDAVEREIRSRRSELVTLHEERLSHRRAQAQALQDADADVRLEIVAFGDRSELESRREVWFPGAGLREPDWTVLVGYLAEQGGSLPDRLAGLATALRVDVEATAGSGKILDVASSAVAKLVGSARAAQLSGYFFRALQRGDRIRVDEMERFVPEDAVETRVRAADGSFKPVTQGSLGERSTAMLSLLLSSGDQPLIIDQPEDDLDNRYVYEVVVDLLRRQKFHRQIIIATHNANIPVNGDAELIVALGVQDRLGMVLQMGSIDRADVKEEVSRIMEGSAEAFRLRRERYGY